MLKIALIILLVLCSMASATYTYVGPYQVDFDSTEHPVLGMGFDPSYGYISNDEVATYRSLFIGNNSTMTITIIESKSDEIFSSKEATNYTSLVTPDGSTRLKISSRIIDGLDSTFAIFKNNSNGELLQKAIIEMDVNTGGYSLDTHAAMAIRAENYTEYQFDRLLDTFEFKRLKND